MDEQRTTPVAGEDSTAETQSTQRTDAEQSGGSAEPVVEETVAEETVAEETGDRRQETGGEAAAPGEDAVAVVAAGDASEETGDRRQEAGEDAAAPVEGDAAVVEAPAETADRSEETGESAAAPVEGDAAVAAPEVDEVQLKAVIEAIVYVAEESATAAQIANSVRQPEDLVKRLLDSLVAEYADAAHGVMIREVAGGYKMATKAEHHEAVRAFAKSLKPPLKLSLAALETLATIAYKQPITAPEIMEIRGVQGAGVLKTLLDRKLIQAGGRKNVVGRPILYRTTKEFLVQFGLKDLSELPTLKEFEELRRLAAGEDETAAAGQETGDRSEETGDRSEETGDRRQEAGEKPAAAAGQETGEKPAAAADGTVEQDSGTGAGHGNESGENSEAPSDGIGETEKEAAVTTEKDG